MYINLYIPFLEIKVLLAFVQFTASMNAAKTTTPNFQYNLYISLYVVSVRIQTASHFYFHMFWEILQRKISARLNLKVKLFIYTITKYIHLKNK